MKKQIPESVRRGIVHHNNISPQATQESIAEAYKAGRIRLTREEATCLMEAVEEVKTVMIRFRCRESEAEQIREAAQASGLTTSQYIRDRLLDNR